MAGPARRGARWRRWIPGALLGLALLGLLPQAGRAQALAPEEAEAIAAEAYLYGFSPVEVYRVISAGAAERGGGDLRASFNRWGHRARIFTPADRQVRRPNCDTAYSQLIADLRAEPLLIEVPAVEPGRFCSLQFIDLYTHNFGYAGSRASGNGGGRYLLAGPGWQGAPPADVDGVLRSETELAVVLCRVQLLGASDLDAVHRVQSGLGAVPLSAHLGLPAPPAPALAFPAYDPEGVRGLGFLETLSFVLRLCPPHPSEAALRGRLARIGVVPGSPFDPAALPAEQRRAVERGLDKGRAALAEAVAGKPPLRFGSREVLANDYLARAVATEVGIFGNSREEAVYHHLTADAGGAPLDGTASGGRGRYALRFSPGELPPVEAFWSVTLYELPSGALSANPIDRYLINSSMLELLARDADGGLTLWIQHAPPDPARASNWLPAPAGPFDLVLRLYWPRQEALDGSWKVPAVEPVR